MAVTDAAVSVIVAAANQVGQRLAAPEHEEEEACARWGSDGQIILRLHIQNCPQELLSSFPFSVRCNEKAGSPS
ncbi:hypothetical protein Q8A73_016636 [Channa argus]|nr:hypothetical protein Q8A73_016636 [Channa argus]